MRRFVALSTVALVTLILGGCGMSAEASKLGDYKQQAEQVRGDVVAQFPPEVTDGGSTNFIRSEPIYETVNATGDSASSPAHWEVLDDWTFPQRDGLSKETAEAVISHLEAEGWEHTDQTTQGGGFAIVDSLMRTSDVEGDSWFLRLTHTIPGGDPAEGMQILVSSPTTTRGETPPASTP
jgi:hypothetical protein